MNRNLLLILLALFWSCNSFSDGNSNNQKSTSLKQVELFSKLVYESKSKIISNSYLGCIKELDSIKIRDTVIIFDETTKFNVKFASYSWNVVLDQIDTAILTINYWAEVDDVLFPFLEFHNHNEILQKKYAHSFKVGNFYCSANLSNAFNMKAQYFCFLEQVVLRKYIEILHTSE